MKGTATFANSTFSLSGRQRKACSTVDNIVMRGNTALFPQFCSASPSSLTVWRRSLIFSGKGYTVYDSAGSVIFRVDNYAAERPKDTLLMDFSGKVLLTIRHSRKLSTGERWEAFRGDVFGRVQGKAMKPLFTATTGWGGLVGNKKITAAISSRGRRSTEYLITHDAGQTCSFKIYNQESPIHPVAQVHQKCVNIPTEVSLGKDVLSLSVQPGIDQVIVMGLVIINYAMRGLTD